MDKRECLECKKEFEPKRETAKFCSDKCRVKYFRKNGKRGEIKPLKLQVMFNSIMEMIEKTNERLDGVPTLRGVESNFKPIAEQKTQFEGVATPKPQMAAIKPKTVIKYIQERIEADNPETYEKWLAELEADPYLSEKQKAYAKIGRLD